MHKSSEVKADIYKLMDQAGLDAGTLSNARMPLHQIVNKIRTELAVKLTHYIYVREKPKKINVDYER